MSTSTTRRTAFDVVRKHRELQESDVFELPPEDSGVTRALEKLKDKTEENKRKSTECRRRIHG